MAKKFISVLLLKDNNTLGKAGSIKNVRLGYARNYLIPEGIGCIATPAIKKHYEQKLNRRNEINETILKESRNIKNSIDSIGKIVIRKRIGNDNLIFGTITDKEIKETISKLISRDISKKSIIVPDIKSVGIYELVIKIHQDVETFLKLQVIPLNID